MSVLRTLALFALAAVAEIGGAWLIWQGVRERRGIAFIGAGIVALALYGFVATLQEDAYWDAESRGLRAKATIYSNWRKPLAEMKDAIGVSIRGNAEVAEDGEAEGCQNGGRFTHALQSIPSRARNRAMRRQGAPLRPPSPLLVRVCGGSCR